MKYYGVYKDILKYQFEEIKKDEIKNINNNKYLFFISLNNFYGSNANWGQVYNVLDINLKPTVIEINGWKTESKFATDVNWYGTKDSVKINISDIKGIIKNVSVKNSLNEIFSYLIEKSKFYTWENIDTIKENSNLKIELSRLNNELTELNDIIKNKDIIELENVKLNEKLKNYNILEEENNILKDKLRQISNILFEFKNKNDYKSIKTV